MAHSVTLSGLTPNTIYHYQVKSRDASNNLTTSTDATFTTNSVPNVVVLDTTPPVVSNISASTVSSIAENIAWTTNEFSTSTIRWSTNTSYSSTLLIPETAGLTHTGALVGLSPSTTYNYCIDATDLSGNISHSCGNTFTTASVPIVADVTPPVITDLSATSLEPHDANIIWTTDELAVSTLTYGTTTSYGFTATLPATALLAHTATLLNLDANTTYYYCIHATDLAGNVASSCSGANTFTTAAQQVMLDTNPPTVSSVTIAPITTTSATVGWTTDEIAGGYVEYGTTDGYGSETTFDTNLALTHEATLTGLTPATDYHYRVHSRDEAGNAVVTPDETFTTASVPIVTPNIIVVPVDTTPPVISEITTGSIASTLATINWTTNELAVSTLEYGTTSGYGSSAELNGSVLLAHDATLVDLTPSTTYYYCIHATDIAGNPASSCGHSFVTSAPPVVPDTTAPVTSVIVVSSITPTSASVHWTSSEQANSQIQYGTTTSYGTDTGIETETGLSGNASLTNLLPSTTYHFRMRSYDASGNVGLSPDYTFTTGAVSVNGSQTSGTSSNAAPIISEVGADTLGETSATIEWTTDIPADSYVEYGNSENLGLNASSPMLTTSHEIALTNLSPDTNYQFRVISKPIGGVGFQTTSRMYDFTTLATPVVIDPAANILSVTESATNSVASVSFTTDETVMGQIEYGTTSYGLSVAINDWNTMHTSSLLNLNSGTTYHFRVKAVDTFGNITYSEDHIFTISGSVSTSSPQVVSLQNNTETVLAPAPQVSSGGGGGSGGSSFAPVPVPDLVTAEGVDSQIVFTWNNPQTSGFAGTVLVRRAGNYPGLPTDGQVVYSGPSQTFTDTSLTNGTTYYYALFSYNSAGQYSNAIHVSTAPKAGVNEIKIDRNAVSENALPIEHFTQDIKLGDNNLEVEHLQQVLNTVGVHQSGLTSGYFGPLTQTSLKQFQAKYNLPQTGIADSATRAMLDSISDSWMVTGAPTDAALIVKDLKQGDTGDDVGDLQEFLTFEGSYKAGIISNTFGPLTKTGVKNFQSTYGVTPVSGYVGYKTRHTIQTVLGL